MGLIVWRDKEVLKEVDKVVDRQLKIGSGIVEKKAKETVPVRTGALKASIESNKQADGHYRVSAQGPEWAARQPKGYKFYAFFVEMGTHKMAKKPYLRPALKGSATAIQRLFNNQL